MAIPSTIQTLSSTGDVVIYEPLGTFDNARGTRIDISSTPSAPNTLVVSHQQGKRAGVVTDRHLVQAVISTVQTSGAVVPTVVSLTIEVPRVNGGYSAATASADALARILALLGMSESQVEVLQNNAIVKGLLLGQV